MKKIPDNFPAALSGRAVPRGFNTSSNRIPLPIAICSDTTNFQVWFYEYHGMHWYSVVVPGIGIFMNSVPYLSIGNCVTAFRGFVRDHGFVFEDRSLSESRLRSLRKPVPVPKSWKV